MLSNGKVKSYVDTVKISCLYNSTQQFFKGKLKTVVIQHATHDQQLIRRFDQCCTKTVDERMI
jgi:hypothetical protein